MPVAHLGGYYMDFTTTRALMEFYDIPDKGVENDRLDYPLNDWLAKNNKVEVLAGTIMHPSKGSEVEDGVLLITQQVWYKSISRPRAMSLAPLPERDVDVRVKQWLISGGATEDKLEWLSIWDTFGLTVYGIRPFRNNEKGRRPINVDMTIIPKDTYLAWVAEGMPDERTYFGDEVYDMMTAKSRRP
ncbi:hypothetical protein BDZ89DRAFT_1074168 [Hymenopellis radicata]|nr:hypothetical protein BDZ89DRAFT_1074168 [Hymenopellis radicata]